MSTLKLKYTLPFGKHKGKALGDVPAQYLLWLVDEGDNCPWQVKEYVEKERRTLELERCYGEDDS